MPRIHTLHRTDNALVLSEDLDGNAVQNLIEVALANLFPGQCEEWLSAKQYIHDVFKRERKERKSVVARNLAEAEGSLQRTLREEVVERVMSIFPYVLFPSYLDQMQKAFT